jgi:hypothetical protein
MFNNSEVSRTILCPCMAIARFFAMGQDAARAQVKMDGAILSKRIIKVDFAHQEKLNPILKNRRSAKDATQVTTLSMLKGTQHIRYFLATGNLFITIVPL